MRKHIFALALWAACVTDAIGKTWIIVLPADFGGPKETLTTLVGEAILPLQRPDHVLVYAARPTVRLLADIHVPDDPNAANRAWVKRKLGAQAAPVAQYIAGLPSTSSTEPPPAT